MKSFSSLGRTNPPLMPPCKLLFATPYFFSLNRTKRELKLPPQFLPSSPTFPGKTKKEVKNYKLISSSSSSSSLVQLSLSLSLSLACTNMPASTDDGAGKISIRVRGQDDRVLFFKINPRVRLSKMFNIFCERRQLDVHTVQFLYEGNRITGRYTPYGLGMEDGAEICAFVHQSGGGRQQQDCRIPC
ncbi:uncharacterized protein LOC115743268 [Rhodamnia argentea]|uniref:Uncharacterized protein LOC115743268 n=1 Tax=Rhodamnia argentea TaxID=178133 RepID=A0A8B8PI83_9MYRT|nr:uncharacterized protein LOC115743268 [Rhodamnia argentea]